MHEREAQFGMIPGKAVPRVKASEVKAMWKLLEDVKAGHPGRPGNLGQHQIAFKVEHAVIFYAHLLLKEF